MNVELIDHMGSDLTVVNAARVSFAKESEAFNDKDAKLINYLAREKHILPFRHPTISVRCKAPIFLARQLGKHQVGLTWSEESRRYIDSEPEFFFPDKWRKRAENVKQGSLDEEFTGYVETEEQHGVDRGPQEAAELAVQYCSDLYDDMINAGVAPEQARMILPQSMYVNWVWTGSLLAFYQLYKLRTEHGAQMEAQHFANQLEAVVAPLYPASWAALKEYA
ncbi:MAG: FAD-dependent thymidylate synthase [Aurantimicrobium sp.]|uniref:FAD-dependent thymidylate synthase n=1 Tax=Aurantimicrobium sp. TaxID=1930784 RepID=UPI002FC78F78